MTNQINLNSLRIERKETHFIKPSKYTPLETLSLSTLDNDPLNEVMYTTIYAFKANHNTIKHPESLLREALSNLLVYYYPLSGMLMRRNSDQRLQLTCNGDGGVPFTVAKVDLELSCLNYLENVDIDTASLLVPEFDVNYDKEIGYHPLALQVTKFSCGGFTIGTALTHAVCDGFGVARFIHALMELAGGKSEPSVVPIWERERLVGKIDDQSAKVPGGDIVSLLAISPYMPTSDLVTETMNIKADNMKSMKYALLRESEFGKENVNVTTFEALSAYTWRSRSRALDLNPNGITVLGVAVGIRHVVDPPLPEGYYGNAYIDVYIELTVRELNELPIIDIVKLIKKAKNNVYDKEYVEEELRNTERLVKTKSIFEGRDDGLFFLTDWRNIGWFGSMDFGWNEPVNLVPLMPRESAKNIGMLLRPSKLDESMEGGVKVVMTLPRVSMNKFKQEMESLTKFSM